MSRTILIAVYLVSAVMVASAQRHETFADNPAKRTKAVQQAREKAQRDKEAARQWAAARGLPMRYDDGRRVMELMAIRNDRPVYYTTQNHNAAISTAADQVRNTAPYSVDGSSVTVGIWDGGSVLTTHQEFGGRVTNVNGVASHYHSTHVGGTIAAAGIVPNAEGMAPAAHIDSYDWNQDIAEMSQRAASYPGEPGKIYLSNHSYGTVSGWTWAWKGTANWYWPEWLPWGPGEVDPTFGQYHAGAIDYDQVVYDAPYFLPFVSAGNERSDNPANGNTVYYLKPLGPGHAGKWTEITYDNSQQPLGDGAYDGGYDTISGEATAKNIMTVGAVYDAVAGGTRFVANGNMVWFSSWGPADDGRVKPDIVANGYDVYSCYDTSNNAYASLSGTSMASPNACGSAALLVDYYGQQFPGQAMRASTLKGLIIHTADDKGRPGPDYTYGWGLMNTLAAAELIKDYADGNAVRMTEATLAASTNMSDLYVYESAGTQPIRATLCWTDPPGPEQTTHDSRTPVLVNDLDLKIVGPGGTNYPYSLNYNAPAANATTNGKNGVDNVEQVYIAAPAAGSYTIVVDYAGALQAGEQHYSLLLTGLTNSVSHDKDQDGLPDDWELKYYASETGAVASVDSDGDGEDNWSEYISGHNPTNPQSFFAVTGFDAPATGSIPFVVSWTSVSGRVYGVNWAGQLTDSFTNISGLLPYPTGSYTDTVDHAETNGFYRVEVQLPPQ